MATTGQTDRVWDHAQKARGKDPQLYRKDPYGRLIFKRSYGLDSEMGWTVDHIKPKSRGGSDATVNLQALSTKVNRVKGDTLRKKSRHSRPSS